MIKELSFKTKFGWINIREVNERIVAIKFGKKNSKSKSKNLINQHLLVVPCHRVVRSDGTLGGFSSIGGIKLKKKLIHLENNE